MKKYEVYINGQFTEGFKTREAAAACIRRNVKQDLYERACGYTNPLPRYELRTR